MRCLLAVAVMITGVALGQDLNGGTNLIKTLSDAQAEALAKF